MILGSNFVFFGYFIWRILFLIALLALPGTFYAPLCLTSNASFVEKLLTTNPKALFYSLQAKYYLYCIFSLIMLLSILPSIFIGVKIIEIISSFLFSIGFMHFLLFHCSLLSYQPLDIKSTSFYNLQGLTFLNQFIPILFFTFILGFIALMNWFFDEKITLIIISTIGIIFISMHKLWLRTICSHFEKTKYRRIECFREK
jgi:hypothetical protein